MGRAQQFTSDYNKFIGDKNEIGGKKYVKTIDMEDGSIFIFNKTLNKFVAIVMPSGDDVMFKDARPIPQDIGGYKKGDIINNVPLSEVVRTILFPYEYPRFGSFYLSGVPLLEIGDTLNTVVFNWGFSNTTNVVDSSVTIFRGSTPIMTHLNASPVSMDLGITNSLPKQEIFKITAVNTKGDTFYMTTGVNWSIPVYYGVSKNTSLTEEEIEAMTSLLCTSISTYTFAMSGPGYKYIAIPTVLISKSLIFKDAITNYDVPMVETTEVGITHKSGILNNYTLFRSYYLLNGDVSIKIT